MCALIELATAHTVVIDALFVSTGVVALAAVVLALAWWRRSIAAAVLVCVLLLLAGLWLRPWLVLLPSFFGDPPATQWLAWRQIVSGVWAFLGLAGLVSLVALIQLRRL